MKPAPLVAVLALLLTPGCRGRDAPSTRATPDASSSAASACEPRTTDKLGVPFAKLCPKDLPLAGAVFEPFWISSAPLPCAAGEHAGLRCPAVTPLAHPAPGEARAPGEAPSRLAAVVDADTAQSWCFMRFAGRLPTREERARAEVTLGLSAVMVAKSASDPVHFELRRLSEWVTESPCEAPNAGRCQVGMYPSDARAPIPWGSLVACDGAPLAADAGAPLLDVGETCPASGFDWDASGGKVPCAVKSVVERAPVFAFALSCKRPGPAERHPDDDPGGAAAVRCVMPGTMR